MNKLEQMGSNLTALRLAFELHLSFRNANPQENEVLSQYVGFGGLSEILMDPKEDSHWSESNRRMRPVVQEFHDLVDLYMPNDSAKYIESAKNSVLTGFYTPTPIIEAFSSSLKASGIPLNSVLDPSAGSGRFIDVIKTEHRPSDVLMFEKDLLTGLLLSAELGDSVRNEGFENVGAQKDNRFDLVASNIPFGNISVFDPAFARKGSVEKQATGQIHNYFFLKSVELARPGGLVALITTDSFANTESNRVFRQNLLQKARLISAVRLPNNLFKDAGTQAGSDFIIVQKRAKPVGTLSEQEKLFLQTYSPVPDAEAVKSNLYFESAPNKIINTSRDIATNQYGKPALIYTHSGEAEQIGKELFEVFQQDILKEFDYRLYQAKSVTSTKRKSVSAGQLDLFSSPSVAPPSLPASTDFTGELYEHLSQGSIVNQAGTIGKLQQDEAGKAVVEPMRLSSSQRVRWETLIDIRDNYFKLVHQERDNQTESPQYREKLNESYDSFKSSFGSLKDRANIDTILIDPSGRQLLSLETYSEVFKSYEKTDIFHRPVHIANAQVSSFTPQEALAASLNRFGGVNLEYIAEISGERTDGLLIKLAEQIYYNPIGGDYQIKDVLGSGNIQQKIEQITALGSGAQVDPTEIERTLRYLESVKPEPVPFELIDFNLGERWLDTDLYSRFASQFFSTEVAVSYSSAIDDFGIKGFDHRYNPKLTEEFAVQSSSRSYTGLDLLHYALLDNVPNITKKINDGQGKEITVRDSEKIRLASQKIDSIRNGFVDWMGQLPHPEKKVVEETYNRLYNSEVKQKYDGAHLKFPGLRLQNLGIRELYGSQKDTAWMLIQNAGGIVDHEVGTGKTLTMIVTAYEMKRLGLVAKPMIVGMKANVGAIADTFKAAYPDARILAPSEKDFSKQRREMLFDAMANTAWDCIILTHDQFAKIPQSLDVQKRLIGSEVANLEKDLTELKRNDYRVGTALLKGLERRKVSLTNNLNSVLHQIDEKRDDTLDFEKMGIDFLQVDESHKFKNLLFTTRHDRVAGLGNQVGSQRALNMLFAVRTIQEKRRGDSGVAFYSGTPISNSLTELYLLFKYLRPKELERQKMENFDSWLSVYAKKTTDYEYSVTNQLIEKSRFRHFIKVPELAACYSQITDFRTAEMVGVDRPSAVHQLMNIKPTEQQAAFTENLVKFAASGDGTLLGRGRLSESEERAKMLIATNYSKKSALDMRLIDPTAGDHPNNKVSQAAAVISRHYKESTPFKGTQIVFCDLGTPSGTSLFNVYDALKAKLIQEYELPAKEIRFIHDAKNDKQRQQIIRDTNEGRIRVLMGSTEKLGTGVNAQKHIVAMHHLDVPWKPSDFEQRVGRGVRAGNLTAKNHFGNQVQNYVYAVERTLDNFMFNLLQNKALFISQIKNQNLSVRRIDEGGMDETNGMNYAEYVALLSGNKDLLEKAKIEKQIASLESEKTIFNKDMASQRRSYSVLEKSLDRVGEVLEKIRADQKRLYGDKKESLPLVAEEKIEDLGIAMLTAQQKRAIGITKIADFRGFELSVDTFRFDGHTQHKWEVRSPNGIVYRHNNGYLNSEKIRTAGEYVNKATSSEQIAKLLKQQQERQEELARDIKIASEAQNKPWPKEAKLREFKTSLADVERRLTDSLKPEGESSIQGTVKNHETETIARSKEIEESMSKEPLTPMMYQKSIRALGQ
ncbi:helicase-related protein [Persicitalea jodogahamensis]|uniref:Helicase C-terminal domain-containing protein n=1 Tax=Persicitalea jodogahamensis TaxID=402147 RepID=A0A8J3GC57_9BACT|nr:helicase-related protein [Persicitalea jodogahamensis]GHB86220.1 hypothetical protein GCM10007390_47120 [Persicitalea jodogahamensis]